MWLCFTRLVTHRLLPGISIFRITNAVDLDSMWSLFYINFHSYLQMK